MVRVVYMASFENVRVETTEKAKQLPGGDVTDTKPEFEIVYKEEGGVHVDQGDQGRREDHFQVIIFYWLWCVDRR